MDVLYLFPQRGELVRVVTVGHLSLWRSERGSLANDLLGYPLLLSGLVLDVGVSEVLKSRAVDRRNHSWVSNVQRPLILIGMNIHVLASVLVQIGRLLWPAGL